MLTLYEEPDMTKLPTTGWTHQEVTDSKRYDPHGELTAKCDICGGPHRYVHHITHPAYTNEDGDGITLEVGCKCAVRYTNFPWKRINAEEMKVKRLSRKKWLIRQEANRPIPEHRIVTPARGGNDYE